MKKIVNNIVNDNKQCERIIVDAFIERFYNVEFNTSYQFLCRPDETKPILGKAPDFKYIDTKTKEEQILLIEITRLVNRASLRKCSMVEYEFSKKINGEMVDIKGTFWVIIKAEEYPVLKKRRDRIGKIDKIIKKIDLNSIELQKPEEIDKGVFILKINNDGSDIVPHCTDIYSDYFDKPEYIMTFLNEAAAKFSITNNKKSNNIVIILRKEGTVNWFETGNLIHEVIRGNNTKYAFPEGIISRVYEIIFDFEDRRGIILNTCYPNHKSQLLMNNLELFDKLFIYHKFRNLYF